MSASWFAAVLWLCERGSLCTSHGSLCHTHRSRRAVLFGSCWEKIFCCPGALASTKHPHHHQLFTHSAVHPHCLTVCVCVHVCVHNMLTSDLWGDALRPRLSQNQFFFGSVLWLCAEEERSPSFMDSARLIYLEPSSAGSSGWGLLTGGNCGLPLFYELSSAFIDRAINVHLSDSGSVCLICQNAWSKLSALCVLGIHKGKIPPDASVVLMNYLCVSHLLWCDCLNSSPLSESGFCNLGSSLRLIWIGEACNVLDLFAEMRAVELLLHWCGVSGFVIDFDKFVMERADDARTASQKNILGEFGFKKNSNS